MLVSCICPTMESRRERWLPQAIACFEAQEWSEKELIIVAEYSRPEGLPTKVNWVELSYFMVNGRITIPTIGWKRNVAVAHSAGDFICHLDDDDISYPGRIVDQVKRLVITGKAVTGYHSMRFHHDDGRKFQYSGGNGWAFDTSLCYRKSFWQHHLFADINDGLEAGFRDAALHEKQFIGADGSEMMHATIHAGNTGPRIMTPGNLNWTEL